MRLGCFAEIILSMLFGLSGPRGLIGEASVVLLFVLPIFLRLLVVSSVFLGVDGRSLGHGQAGADNEEGADDGKSAHVNGAVEAEVEGGDDSEDPCSPSPAVCASSSVPLPSGCGCGVPFTRTRPDKETGK